MLGRSSHEHSIRRTCAPVGGADSHSTVPHGSVISSSRGHSPELAHSRHSPYPSSESPSGVETNSLNLSSIRLKKPGRLTYARASISPREPWSVRADPSTQ